MNAGFGIQLLRGDGATPEVFTAIAQVTDVAPPKASRATIDISNHASPGKYAEYMGGLRDAGEVGLTIQYEVDPTHAHNTGLQADLESDTPRNYRVKFPDTANTIWQISGLVTGFEPSAPRDGVITAQVTIKASGGLNFILFAAYFAANTNPNLPAATVGTWVFSSDPLKTVSGDASLASGTVGAAGGTIPAAGDWHGRTVIGAPPTASDYITIALCFGTTTGYVINILAASIGIIRLSPGATSLGSQAVTFIADDVLTWDYDYETGVITVYKNGVSVITSTADLTYRDQVSHGVTFTGSSGKLRTSYVITRS